MCHSIRIILRVLFLVSFAECLRAVRLESKTIRWKHNFDLHYTTTETKKEKPAIILVPGFGVGTFHFQRNTLALSQHFDVYSFDLLGQGKSWPEDGLPSGGPLTYSIELWTEQLLYFIENVVGRPAHVAGNSLGGYLSVYGATQSPKSFLSLSLLNATPFWSFQSKKPVFSLWDGSLPAPNWALRFGKLYFDTLRSRATVKSMLEAVYADSRAIPEQLVEDIIESASRKGGPEAFTSILFSPKIDSEFDDMLASLSSDHSIPVSIVNGREDPWVTPYWGARAKRANRDAVFFSLEGAGHCPHHEAPQATNEILINFINTVENVRKKDGGNGKIVYNLNDEWPVGWQKDFMEEHGALIRARISDGEPTIIDRLWGRLVNDKTLK